MVQVLSPEVSLLEHDGTLTLCLEGVVGIMCAAELHAGALVLAEHAGPVAVDASQVEHLDCSAAQILLALQLALAGAGRAVRAEVAAEAARRLLALSGVATALGLA